MCCASLGNSDYAFVLLHSLIGEDNEKQPSQNIFATVLLAALALGIPAGC